MESIICCDELPLTKSSAGRMRIPKSCCGIFVIQMNASLQLSQCKQDQIDDDRHFREEIGAMLAE
jgi:hypothetical protein